MQNNLCKFPRLTFHTDAALFSIKIFQPDIHIGKPDAFRILCQFGNCSGFQTPVQFHHFFFFHPAPIILYHKKNLIFFTEPGNLQTILFSVLCKAMMNGILHNRLQNKFDNLAFLDFFRYINLYLKPVGKADILYLQIVVRLPQFLPDPYDILL